MTVIEAFLLIEGCTDGARLLGSDPKAKYRELAALVHPDKVTAKHKARADSAFSKLSAYYSKLTAPPKVVETKLGKWLVQRALAKGDIADLYLGAGASGPAVIKIARDAVDNDLLAQEYFALTTLGKSKDGTNFKKYLPVALEAFEADDRAVNVLSVSEETKSLADLIEIDAIKGDFRHLVWMGNRALSALGFIHRCGLVHGAVVPEHLLYGPRTHGLTLVDWCYSVTLESKRPIQAMVTARKALYPPEVSRKLQPSSATDIYMLIESLRATGAAPPKRFKDLYTWCLAASPASRPNDAWAVQDRWVQLAKEEYGEPKYLELVIPKN